MVTKCQRLFFLEVSDFEEPDQQVHTGDATSDERPPLISLHAVTGIGSADCMQVKVGIGNHQFTALLDSGSTHNFISSAAARHVGLSSVAQPIEVSMSLWPMVNMLLALVSHRTLQSVLATNFSEWIVILSLWTAMI